MKKLMLDIDSLGVETFMTVPDMVHAAALGELISKKSCIEQCTTSCTPIVG
jgi:hypothetical protein